MMIVLIIMLHPPFLTAANNSSLEQGIALYQREAVDEAVALLEKARVEDPSSTRAAYYLGIAYKKQQKYPEAKKNLLDAVNNNPKIKEALPELVEVLYEMGEIKEAKKWIKVSEKQNVRPAQTAFLKGLVLMKDGNTGEAVDSLQQAKSLDAGLTQAADYQIGLAHVKDQNYEEARRLFREVVTLDPNADISAYASEYTEALAKRAGMTKPWHFNAGFFTEWDSNVVLKPSDTTTIGDIGNQNDFREVVTASADYTYRINDPLALKFAYDLYYANQTDLNDFDVNSHTFTIAPSYTTKNAIFSVPVQYNHTLVDSNDLFLTAVTINPQVSFKITEHQIGMAGIKFQEKDYHASITDGAEDRDGFRWAPGVGWYYIFQDGKGSVGIRYELDSDNTDGNNWDYLGNRITPSVQFAIPHFEKLRASLAADLYFQEFRHSHTVFGQKRSDQGYTLSSLLSYDLTRNFELQFRYTYVNHKSNLTIYEYDRHVFSTGVVAKF